jgi:fibronectin type 3 domain-containing protein
LGSTNNSYFIDDTLDYDTTYFYSITALDRNNLESDRSNIVSGKPENYFKPYRPQSLEINGRNWNNKISIELSWAPSYSTDIAGYEIYRSTSPDFSADSTNLHDFINGINYSDTSNIQTLQTYFYYVSAVDKGGLKSSAAGPIGDLILDKPQIVFPANNSQPDNFDYFKIISCSSPAIYKLVIKSNPHYGVVVEENIESSIVADTLEIPFNSYYIENYKTYYWQVFVYSDNSNEPNTFIDMNRFAIYPKP